MNVIKLLKATFPTLWFNKIFKYIISESKIIKINIRDLLYNVESYKGVLKEKLGTDNRGPYILDHEGNKHYLIEEVRVGERTYYLPALLVIKEPPVSMVEIKD